MWVCILHFCMTTSYCLLFMLIGPISCWAFLRGNPFPGAVVHINNWEDKRNLCGHKYYEFSEKGVRKLYDDSAFCMFRLFK